MEEKEYYKGMLIDMIKKLNNVELLVYFYYYIKKVIKAED